MRSVLNMTARTPMSRQRRGHSSGSSYMGLAAIAYEMTRVPRETCSTFVENDHVLEAGLHFAIPLRVCLDMGHRPLCGIPEEADHLEWIRRYGSRCEVIDCQQTDREASRHWPFTEEANGKGIIRVAESGARHPGIAS